MIVNLVGVFCDDSLTLVLLDFDYRLVQRADPRSQPDLVLQWSLRLLLSQLLSLAGCRMEHQWSQKFLRISRTQCRSISETQISLALLQERLLLHMRTSTLHQRLRRRQLMVQLQLTQARQERRCIHLRQRTRPTCRHSCLLLGWGLHSGLVCQVRLAWRHSLDTHLACSSRRNLVLVIHRR